MKIEQLEADLQKAESKLLKDIPRQKRELEAQADKLRTCRQDLLAAAGLGEEGAAQEIEAIEKRVKDVLREKHRLDEISHELNNRVNTLDVQILRAAIKEQLSDLPKLKDTLNAAIKAVSKALNELELGRIKNAARYFSGENQVIEERLRAAIDQAITSAVAAVVNDPQRPPVIDSQRIEAILKNALEACSKREDELQTNLTNGRQHHAFQRQQLEAQAAL